MNPSWTQRFDEAIHHLQESGGPREIESKRLFSVVRPPTPKVLADAVARLLSTGKLRARYRVVSRETGSGIAEYPDIRDIPDDVFDPTTGATVRVDPTRDVELVFQTPRPR